MMPYRAAIESVLARCDELRARVQELQHVPVARRECETMDEALAWEGRLRAHVAKLEANRERDADCSPAVTATSNHDGGITAQVPTLVTIAAIIGVICIAALGVASMTEFPHRSSARSYALFSGTVTRSAHAHERCTVQVDRTEDGCEIDLVCPSFESRIRRRTCELDARMSFTTAEIGPIDIELDAWR